LQTLFKIERVYLKSKDEELRRGLLVTIGTSKSKNIFKKWGIKLANPWVIKKIRANGKIKIENPYSKRVKTVTKGMIQLKVPLS